MADIVFTGQAPSAIIGADEMPNNVDIEIYKGDWYEFFVRLQDATGESVTITGDTPRAQLRKNYEDPSAIELDCSLDDDGDIRIYISSAVSSQLDPTSGYIWDLQTTNYKGDVKTWVTGDISVQNEVTK